MDTLLNWLWQGLILAGAAAAALRVWPRSDDTVRLRICWMALVALALLPCVPFLLATPFRDALLDPADRVRVPMAALSAPAGFSLIALWCGWVLWSSARLAIAAVRVRRARAAAVPLPERIDRRLRHWSQVRGQGRRTSIVVSPRVRAAAVLGVGSPVIAVAPDLVHGLDHDQLDLIVLHEWAHVQRRDDVANVAERLVLAVLGWHPAARWIASRLHLEREAAADRLAASTGGSARRYAASLAALATLRRGRAPLPVPAAESQLRARIARVLAPAEAAPRARTPRAIVVCVLGIAGIGAGAFELLTTGALSSAQSASDAAAERPAYDSTLFEEQRRLPVALIRRDSATRRAPGLSRIQSSPQVQGTAALMRAGGPVPIAAGAIPHLPVRRQASPAPPPLSWPGPALAVADNGQPAIGSADARPASQAWSAAMDTAGAVGRASTRAGSATARVFTRFGTRVAGTF